MKEYKINVKIKLAALWTAATFCYLYGDYFELYTPEKVDSLISGENVLNSPLALFIASLIMVIPPLMIVTSLFLKPNPNKWFNIIFGAIFTIMQIFVAIGSIKPWYSFYVFLAIVEAILTAVIVWNAYIWPSENE